MLKLTELHIYPTSINRALPVSQARFRYCGTRVKYREEKFISAGPFAEASISLQFVQALANPGFEERSVNILIPYTVHNPRKADV